MGLGADGHTASLFPNTDALDETLLGIAIMMQVHFDIAHPGVSHTRQFVEHARLVLLLRVKERVAGWSSSAIQMPRRDTRPQPRPSSDPLECY